MDLGKFGQNEKIRVEKLSEFFQLISKFSDKQFNIGDYYEVGSMIISYILPKQFKSSIKVNI